MSKFHDYIVFGTYIRILQMLSEDLEWQANIHGVEEYEAKGNLEGGGSYEWIQKLVHGL
jgi:hypothetical protein